MLKWFKENAPIEQKLSLGLGLLVLASLSCFAVVFCVGENLLSLSAALTICGLLACVSMLAAYVTHQAVAAPLNTTILRIESLAAGDVDSPIPFAGQKDCAGRIAKAMHVFRAAAIAKSAAEAEAVEQRRLAEEERRRQEIEAQGYIDAHNTFVTSITTAFEKFADGDLTFRINDAFTQEYEKIRRDFNKSIEKMQQVMLSVAANTEAIRSGTKEISSAADDLSRRTEQQAASLEETAAALDEITTTVRKTAQGATHARQVVSTAKSDAEKGGDVVRQAITAMSGIEKSSQQIGQIIGVIDEIAFQTNLLALNAGVEAARAGDAGRRFRGGRLGSARSGAALGRSRQGNQGADLDLDIAGRARRRSRRRNRQSAGADLHPSRRDRLRSCRRSRQARRIRRTDSRKSTPPSIRWIR